MATMAPPCGIPWMDFSDTRHVVAHSSTPTLLPAGGSILCHTTCAVPCVRALMLPGSHTVIAVHGQGCSYDLCSEDQCSRDHLVMWSPASDRHQTPGVDRLFAELELLQVRLLCLKQTITSLGRHQPDALTPSLSCHNSVATNDC
jgi:hypothetical protein